MITVSVTQDPELSKIVIDGHALFDDPGKDIVCAAVSAIAFGSLNALDALQGDNCRLEIIHNRIEIEALSQNEILQQLLQMLLIELETVEASYPDYLNIRKEIPCDSH